MWLLNNLGKQLGIDLKQRKVIFCVDGEYEGTT